MVNNSDNLSLLQPGNGLAEFVVIHKNNFLSAGTDQMVTGQGSDDFILLIQNGITSETALHNCFSDIIEIIGEMEIMQIVRACDSSDRDGLKDQSCRTVSVEGTGDNAGGFVVSMLMN